VLVHGVVQRVAAHQFLGLGRQRLGLVRELGGLGLGQQRPHLDQHLLVDLGSRRGGVTLRAWQRQQPFERGKDAHRAQQLEQYGQSGLAGPPVLTGPTPQQAGRRHLVPQAGRDPVDRGLPARMHQSGGVAPGLEHDPGSQVVRNGRVERATAELV
jgi:hypothetical protein